jgi:protein O-GlcNAc transferase
MRGAACSAAQSRRLSQAMSKPPGPTGGALAPSQPLDRAMALLQRGELAQAAALYQDILQHEPGHFLAQHLLGVVRGQQGRYEEALALIEGALRARPDSVAALSNHGLILHRMQRPVQALASLDRALALQSDNAEALNNRGNVLAQVGRPQEALASYERALTARPGYAEAWYNRGNVLADLDRLETALESYGRALAIRPAHADALYHRGNVLARLERHAEALANYELTVTVNPRHAEAFDNRGNALAALNRQEEALSSYEQALAIRPDDAGTLSNRGVALERLGRYAQALASHDRAIELRPGDAKTLANRGNVLYRLKLYDQALGAYDQAIAVDPSNADAHFSRGNVLVALRRHELAAASYRAALEIKPDDANALAGLANSALANCDWAQLEAFRGELLARIEGGEAGVGPFALLSHSDDPALQFKCARNFVARQLPPTLGEAARFDRAGSGSEKIRIAYLSADFHAHVLAYQLAELIERHDRARFEVLGVSFASDDGSEIRARLSRGFDRFLDVRTLSDREVAGMLRTHQVDIAVDLMGHTRDARMGIFAERAAPIQVGYLGYAGTSGADYMDYIIGDPVVLPFAHQPFYSERIVQLPDSFFANDTQRKIAPRAPSRGEAGLPEEGFVFCCFNNPAKLQPKMFDLWMRLLAAVPGSVLWLSPRQGTAERNLRQEAERRGIAPQRLVFARRAARMEDHLARHRLADLFLDTLPYNAHATASDALWAGLPVLTCLGGSYASRVAGSLLTAVGLPELVTTSLAGYEALALELARDPARLGALRQKLERQRTTYPLFDTARLCRHIEAAYATMWETWRQNSAPRAFAVAPIETGAIQVTA